MFSILLPRLRTFIPPTIVSNDYALSNWWTPTSHVWRSKPQSQTILWNQLQINLSLRCWALDRELKLFQTRFAIPILTINQNRLVSVWILNLFSRDLGEDQSPSCLVCHDESLSDGQESNPQLLHSHIHFPKISKGLGFLSGAAEMKHTQMCEIVFP